MFVWMRSHQRKLMLIVAILTIIAFVFLYNTTELDQLSANKFANIYGEDVSFEQVQRDARGFNLALALGLTDYVSTTAGNLGDPDPGAFVFNTMVIRHEAAALGIAPTATQIAQTIAQLPVFQTNGGFDRAKYAQFVENVLTPNGFTEVKVEELVRDSLMLQRITALLESPPTAAEVEVLFTNRLLQEASGVAVRFEMRDFIDQADVKPADVKTFYDANTFRLLTPELRTVRYVTFSLPESPEPLDEKAKVAALQKVADESAAFAERALDSSFEEAAKAANLAIETSLPFNASGTIVTLTGVNTNPADLAGPVAKLAPTAFTLSKSQPVSGVLQDGDSFRVMELVEVTDSREQTLEEATPEITAELRELDARLAMEVAADAALDAIREGLKAGKPIAEAATAAGVQTVGFDNISPTGETATPEQRAYADATIVLKEGELGGFQPEAWGGYAVYLAQRAAADDAKLAENRQQIEDFLRSRKQSILLYEWLESATEKSGLRVMGEEG